MDHKSKPKDSSCKHLVYKIRLGEMSEGLRFKDSAARIGRLMKASGFSQAELARRLNVSRPTVGAWVSGSKRPSWTHVQDLAEVFGVSSAQVAGLDAEEETDELSVHEAIEAIRRARAEIDIALIALERKLGGTYYGTLSVVKPLSMVAEGPAERAASSGRSPESASSQRAQKAFEQGLKKMDPPE